MVDETYRPLVHEIFTKVNNAKDKPKKIKVLRDYDSEGLRKLLRAAFDPNISWLLPEGDVPFIANDAPDGTEHTRLEHEARTLKNYVSLKHDGKVHDGNPNLNTMKREQLFIQLLEGLPEQEAKLVIAAKDKKLSKIYKGLNANTVREAFGWDENFMKPGVSRVQDARR
jgi:hypothetical protein